MKVQRHLAPTAAPLSWGDLYKGLSGLIDGSAAKRKLERELKNYFGVKHAFLFTSGKAALTTILNALKAESSRRQVIIPAYTCFSVPSSVVKAGLELALCDVDSQTLDYDPIRLKETIGRETLAIVMPHLLGRPADIAVIRKSAREAGAFVIEDAAQAMGGKQQGQWLGTQGDVGFFSLGRGKNISAGSGGVIVTNSDRLGETVRRVYEKLPSESVMSAILNFLTVTATTLLIHPNMYWLPAGLPFLGLGGTRFHTDFPIRRMDGIRAGLLASWRNRLEQSNKHRVHMADRVLKKLPRHPHVVWPNHLDMGSPLRLPLLMPTIEGKVSLCSLSDAKGLGISPLYPATISKVPELRPLLKSTQFMGAQTLVDRLVTLPVHRFVSETDIDRIVKAISNTLPGRGIIPTNPARKCGPDFSASTLNL
jgi:dTDP-4-amino-4,6-dideoxygalactose transaminase